MRGAFLPQIVQLVRYITVSIDKQRVWLYNITRKVISLTLNTM